MLKEPIGVIGLSVRTANALDAVGIYTVEDLLNCCGKREADCNQHCSCRESYDQNWPGPKRYLLDIANFGDKTLAECRACLAEHGFGKSADE